MKKLKSLILAAAAMVFAVACNKELPEGAPEAAGETVVFTASMDGTDSKAVLNETSKYSEWEAGDKVTIHNGTTGFEFSAAGAGASTELSYTGTGFSGSKFMAAYPSCASADIETKTVNAYIPTWQQAQVGTYHHDAALAVAYTENDVLAFKNATALLKFTVGTDNVTHVVFHGNLAEGITGNVSVSLADGTPKVEVLDTEFTYGEGEEKVVETKKGSWVELYAYHDDEHRYFEKGETYYIAIAPQTFAEGVTVKIRINEGDELLVKTTTKAATFNANTVYNLGEFVYEASAVTPTVSEVYLRPGVWSADGAWFSAHLWGAENQDITLTEEENGLYYVSVSEGQTGMKFCRMNPAYDVFSWNTETETDHVWTETGDLSIPTKDDDKVCYVVTGWDSAEWMTVEDALAYQDQEDDTEDPVTPDISTPKVSTVYFKPGEWNVDGAWFAAYFFGGKEGDANVKLENPDAYGIYTVAVPAGYTKVIFCRMNPDFQEFSWNTGNEADGDPRPVWNQTGNMDIPTEGSSDVCYVAAWEAGSWMTKDAASVEQGGGNSGSDSGSEDNGSGDSGNTETPTTVTIYLKPGVWNVDGAWYAVHLWGGEGDKDLKLEKSDNGLYALEVAPGHTGVIFCRMNPKYTSFSWNSDAENDHVWNQTEDLTFPTGDMVCYVVTGWDSGTWTTVAEALKQYKQYSITYF